MPKSTKEEKYRWIKSILDKEISIKNMAKICPFSERALKYWLANYREYGWEGLENKSRRPKTNPKETPIRIKERIIELRKETKKCALKLKWQLEKENILINARTVGKILKAESLVRKYRVKRMKYKYIKAERKPGELIEIDVKYVPGRLENKRYYQYTAIDTASRWRYLAIYDEQSNYNAIRFFKEVMSKFPYKIQAIKTDNHVTFTNYYNGALKRSDLTVKRIHALDLFCSEHKIVHYLIDKGKPAQNGTVERSHREDQEKFYDQNNFKNIKDLQKKLIQWNIYYNDLEHCGLNGRTPNEALRLFKVQNVRA